MPRNRTYTWSINTRNEHETPGKKVQGGATDKTQVKGKAKGVEHGRSKENKTNRSTWPET